MQSIETNYDQAASLRANASKPVKVIAVTAGKGGVGKTNISVNMAIALAKQNKRVMLLDADLGLANVDVLLGLHSKRNISHVMKGECNLEDVIVEGPEKIQIIPASSGVQSLSELNQIEHAGIISAFSELADNLDYLIIDTAAGISTTVSSFVRSAHEVIVVVCDEPTSITDAYATIKVMSKEYHVNHFHVLANMVGNRSEGRQLYAKLCKVSERFLDVNLDYLGAIVYDELVKKAVKQQKAVIQSYPSSGTAREFKQLAESVEKWPFQVDVGSGSTFFIERLIQNAYAS